MGRYEWGPGQLLDLNSRLKGVMDLAIQGGLAPQPTIDAVQAIHDAKGGDPSSLFTQPTQPVKTSTVGVVPSPLAKCGTETYKLRTIRHDLSDDQIVANFKAAGWTVDSAVRFDRRIHAFRNDNLIETGCWIYVTNIGSFGHSLQLPKAVSMFREDFPRFNLEDLQNLVLGQEEKLLKRGISLVYAPAARFNNEHGRECMAYADVHHRMVLLALIGESCSPTDWFGHCNRPYTRTKR